MSATATPRKPRAQSSGAHFEAFCKRYCRHTKGPLRGKPVLFEPFQRKFWNEALRLDKKGRRVYSFTLGGRPRKNAKTTECAALALYLTAADGEPGPDVAVGSGSKEQAGFVFNQASDFVEANAELSRVFLPQANVILAPSLGGVLKRISSEGRMQLGLNLSGAVIDEIHVFETERERTLYSAIVTATAIREQPLITAITTAGYNKQTLLGELYEAALALPSVERMGKYEELVVARDEEAGFLMWWYGAPEDADIEDRRLWKAVNPLRAVSLKFLERQFTSPAVSEGEFRRFHLNQWTATQERWIAEGVWRAGACELEIPDGAEVYCAVDAALTYDTTALDVAWPLPDGSGRVLHETHVWSARPEVAHDTLVPGGRIDNSLVEDRVLNYLIPRRKLRVRELVYDPRYFEDAAQRLARAGLTVAPMQPTSGIWQDAVARFYIDVQEGKALHRAGEAGKTLTQHVEAVKAIQSEQGWRLSKLRAARPIDACIAMVMAHARAVRRHESVYERRGLLVLGEEAVARRAQSRPVDDEEDW